VKLMPTVCIHSFPLPLFMFKKYFAKGARVAVPSTRHVPPVCVDPKMKNRSRLHWFLADGESRQIDPGATSLLLDLEGNLTECSGSNFLIVKHGAVLSPTLTNILPGVSRQTVKELCAELDIPFIERDLQVFDVVNADEALLSSTPYCVVPVTHVNNIQIGKGKMGPITKRLLAAWSDRVGVDIVQQALRSTKRNYA
jgi:branched-subunit amino acid aminotransferase/4-amino-4-deoxychorismate lyase